MPEKLNFLLLGKTGQGKSATGNSILGRKAFKASLNVTSETRNVSFSFSHFDKHILLVVDGPGLEDTNMTGHEDKRTAAKNMSDALAMSYGGIDAFVYVLKLGNRYTLEDSTTLEALKRIFGPKYLEHVIVVMTGGDLFEESKEEEELDITFHEWCKRQLGVFGNLYKDCKERFVLFNNREKDEEKKRAQVQELVNFALEIKRNQGRYSSQCFEEAEREREKMILEAYAPELKLEIQEKVSLLSADLEKLVNEPNASERDSIRDRISDLRCCIDGHDRGHGVLNDLQKLVESVEENLEDVDKLHALAKDLEKTRKAKKTWTWLGTISATVGILFLFAEPGAAVEVACEAVVLGGATAAITGQVVLGKQEVEIERKQNEIRQKILN